MEDNTLTMCNTYIEGILYKVWFKFSEMRSLSRSITLICLNFLIISVDKHALNGQAVNNETNITVMSASFYSKIFTERRREHQTIIKNMIKSNNYEKNYKLLKLTYDKIYKHIKENNITITSYAFNPLRDGFAQNGDLQYSISILMENCCIAGESLIHFPEISSKIFGKQKSEWKFMLNWCYEFVNSFPQITDESTTKLMSLLHQEINEEHRDPDYINPYHNIRKNQGSKKEKNRHKKIKNGPSLSGGKTEL